MDRRNVLKGLPLVAVTASLPAIASDVEHPWEKARRLARELSDTLAQVEDGDWFAKVYPANANLPPVFFGSISALDAKVYDPLLDAIQAYRDGSADFETNANEHNEDWYPSVSYQPPLEALEAWDKPILTHEAAMAALKLVSEGEVEPLSEMGETLFNLVLAYFDIA